MFEKLEGMLARFLEIERMLENPDLLADIPQWQALLKEKAELAPTVEKYRSYLAIQQELLDCENMLLEDDPEVQALCKDEIAELNGRLTVLEEELKLALIPVDPCDTKGAILEIRAGTGGEEAGLFAADLLRMYTRYAELHGYRMEVISENGTEMGGIKETVVTLLGKSGIYGRLKFESGVHRVQRVPLTESQGRIQTSAATVAVLPVVDDVQVEIRDTDLRIDTYRSSGAGGQHVNKTESAIRITHIPTGIVVQCQDERSQYKNRDKAMQVLRSRLYEHYEGQKRNSEAMERKSMVGSGDRSERIRTYNFPQNRVTDHRIGLTLHKLDRIMEGELDELLDALVIADRRERMTATDKE